MSITLTPGKFYESKDGHVWCCYRVNNSVRQHAAADCIRVLDSRTEYFYLDGRYDSGGNREHTLVKEVEYRYA